MERQGNGVAPAPGIRVPAACQFLNLLEAVFEAAHQGRVEVGVAGRQPPRPVVVDSVIDERRAEQPAVERGVAAQLGLEEAIEERRPGELADQRGG